MCFSSRVVLIYQRTNWRQEYTYDLLDVVNSGEEVKNDLITNQPYKYFCRHQKLTSLKSEKYWRKSNRTLFVIKFYDDDNKTSDEESISSASPVK